MSGDFQVAELWQAREPYKLVQRFIISYSSLGRTVRHVQAIIWAGGRIPSDLRSGTSYFRSTTSNNRSCTSQLRSGTFCWDPPLCWVESKHQTLFKCHESQAECLECSKTPGRRSGTPPLLSALRARASTLQASRL